MLRRSEAVFFVVSRGEKRKKGREGHALATKSWREKEANKHYHPQEKKRTKQKSKNILTFPWPSGKKIIKELDCVKVIEKVANNLRIL